MMKTMTKMLEKRTVLSKSIVTIAVLEDERIKTMR